MVATNPLKAAIQGVTGNGAAYLRVSTEKQDEERQRETISEWLDRHVLTIPVPRWFADIGWARAEADERPDFQRMLREVEAGGIQWIVVDKLNRFGTKNKHQLIAYVYRLQEAGCKLISADNGREWTSEDMLTLLEAAFEGEKSEGECRDRSEMVLDKMRQLAKVGQWLGGRVPYGFDVVAFVVTERGLVERWRVVFKRRDLRIRIDADGRRKTYAEKHNFPPTEQGEVLQLRPTTDPTKLAVVCRVFDLYQKGWSPNAIARLLNQEGVEAPACADHWSQKHIGYMISNPTYIGLPPWNRTTIGKYTKFAGGQKVRKRIGDRRGKQDEADWILPDKPMFAPVVDPRVFKAAQAKVKAEPKRKKEPRSADLWLAGVVHCGNCGGVMHGVMCESTTRTYGTYVCGTANKFSGPKADCPCKMYRVTQDQIVGRLREFFGETSPLAAVTAAGLREVQQKPKALEAAMQRTAELHEQMMDRAGVELIHHDGMQWYAFGDRLVPADEREVLLRLYRDRISDDANELASKLDDLTTEQELLMSDLRKCPEAASRALARIKQRLANVDAQIGETEAMLEDVSYAYSQSLKETISLYEQWSQAQEAVAAEADQRERTRALRKVVDKIIVSFEDSGKKKPIGYVTAIDIIPHGPKNASGKADVTECELEFPRKSNRTSTGSR